jgi:hypothetical protein
MVEETVVPGGKQQKQKSQQEKEIFSTIKRSVFAPVENSDG